MPRISPSPRTSRMKSKRDRELFQAGAEFRAALADIGKQIFLFDDGEKFERRRADQRAAAKSRAVHSGAQRGCEFLVGDERAERQATRQRLGDRDDVRKRAELLVGEAPAGAAQAGLDFIGDQRGIVLRGQLRARDSRILR